MERSQAGMGQRGSGRVDRLLGLFDRRPRLKERRARHRGPATHVVILDGTMSSLAPGHESNAGLTYKLLREAGRRANLSVWYEAGIQWRDWAGCLDVIAGRGLDRQIERAYGWLACRYRPGDRIILMGYSRGAYAVRSLAGVIDHVGLLRADAATARAVRLAYRHYRLGTAGRTVAAFRRLHCHEQVEIAALGCWDTVKALGLGVRLPVLWRWAERRYAFHNHAIGPHIRRAFHALALHETRCAFAPVLWDSPPGRPGVVEQVWFPGAHGDVGGHVGEHPASRPLSNVPLVWMLSRLEACGLPLPAGWHLRFPCDPHAPSIGTWRGWGKIFLARRRRVVGRDPSERIHATAEPLREARWAHVPAE
ncbi:DUF2235 domain-containing protein [Rubellimicrobium sp. CFH 75288]|uniref:DUF2235 domain-containing protein n=1 Tax=Rubellimicrobium sp. CFH 75288 TaxID=2697034 RepID=UPI001FB5871B|nr:DUF2235 domain-containing protein [Rubellimicrobium sp. CFH 75288]